MQIRRERAKRIMGEATSEHARRYRRVSSKLIIGVASRAHIADYSNCARGNDVSRDTPAVRAESLLIEG